MLIVLTGRAVGGRRALLLTATPFPTFQQRMKGIRNAYWGWFFIAAIVVVAVAGLIVATSAGRRKRTDRLKEQYGPEYERTVAEAGEQKAAEKELVARERKRDKLDIRPLTRAALKGYADRWRRCRPHSSTVPRARWATRTGS